MSISLLIAEPDRALQSTLTEFFAGVGFYVQSVSSLETLRNRLRELRDVTAAIRRAAEAAGPTNQSVS